MSAAVERADDDLIGLTTASAAKLLGVSAQRLAAWERIGLVEPQVRRRVGDRYVRVYGLHDLVELRVVKELEDRGQQIRHIRRVVEAHRSPAHGSPLRELRWAVDAGQIYVGFDDGSWFGGRNPRQGVLPETINLEQIRADMRARARERRRDGIGRVERRSRTLGRKPVFAGTRTPVDAVHAYMRRGIDDATILEAFPHLQQADLDTARELLGA
jgi:DNA-binding transcriptional MerR regulator